MNGSRYVLAACALGAGLSMVQALPVAAQSADRPGATGQAGPMEFGPMGYRHDGMHFRSPAAGGGLMHELHGLDLGESQRDEVFRTMHAQAPALRERMKAVHKARAELRAYALSADFDAKRAQALAEALGRAATAAAVLRAETANRIYRLLTPEQQARIARRQAPR